MTISLPFGKRWHLFLSVFLFLLCSGLSAQATHLRAGNIYAVADTTANPVPGRFFFTLVTFSVAPPPFEDLRATLYFGDCTRQEVARESRTLLDNGQNNSFMNVYRFEHIYGPGTYTVSFVGENRNGGIVNISSSVTQTFFLQTTVTVDPLLLRNRSPRMQYPPVDVAVRGQVFVHNPATYDPDGDSLAFKLVEPRIFDRFDACGNPLGKVAPGYQGLENYLSGQLAPGRPAGLTLNVYTGQLTWNNPGRLGEFNIAFVVEEWRGGRLIGRVIRDMQIYVREDSNRPPVIAVPREIYVKAGSSLQEEITVTDADEHSVSLSLLAHLPTSFNTATGFSTQNGVSGTFTWKPEDSDVRKEPYLVVFRAIDAPTTWTKLVDMQPWLIHVVGPAPMIKSAVQESNTSIRLAWDAYTYQDAKQLYIYRKQTTPATGTGNRKRTISAPEGYTLIGQVDGNATSFVDDKIDQGTTNPSYCYRIYAEYASAAGGTSEASAEVCARFVTGMAEELKQQFSFFPNPAPSTLTVQAPNSVQVQKGILLNSSGQQITDLTPRKTVAGWVFDVKNIAAGFYLFHLQTDKGTLVHKLLVGH
ncbi:T9SS C-terminal target domain-containing protein [Rufibacter immobilis]|uniref:T9SS C-terminal target domain-containing protein n=1 Tax=Rufibacter immobilis TaxID=1348778 RepID=A0A3M9N7B3_9BACT|nr:T9SS type A sorting domain-containing protein [Rufibacter immobilis]RNI32908.1 T9SS C-terminal target domain-containing protein [Rufibacter immobilis]